MDLQIHVVGPTENRDVDTHRKRNVHHVPVELTGSLIHQGSLVVVGKGHQVADPGGAADLGALWVSVDGDLAVVLHGLHDDDMIVDERSADGNGVGCSQTISVFGSDVTALNMDLVVLNDPIIAISIEGGAGSIESHQVGISPEDAPPHLQGRGGRSRRCGNHRCHSGRCGGGGRDEDRSIRRSGGDVDNNEEGDQGQQSQDQSDAESKPTEAPSLGDCVKNVSLSSTDILVGRDGDPVAATISHVGHVAIACKALLSSQAGSASSTASGQATRRAICSQVSAAWTSCDGSSSSKILPS
mmetsp:Transcript_47503/g.101611  ORF Transcript_47503/g.101611 Transcript_47503/m.101611 type:complete len:299 (+) Transcript_47503:1278-2174(+)